MSWLTAAKGASAPGLRNYFNRGDYIAEVVSIVRQTGKNTRTKGHNQVIGTFRIVEVLDVVPGDAQYKASNRVGEICASVMDLNGENAEMDAGKLNNMLSAVIGPDWADIEEKVEKDLDAPGLAYAGIRVRATAIGTITAAKKVPITPVTFGPAPEPAADDAQAGG